MVHDVLVVMRPYIFDMLNKLKQNFELVLFTCGTKEYLHRLLNYFDPERERFDFYLSRDECFKSENLKVFEKDLRILLENRKLKDIIIVDNKEIGCVS